MLREPHDRADGWADAEPSADAPAQVSRADHAALQRELEAARHEAAENRNKYLRARAEMENYKRRVERQYADLAKSYKKNLLLKLLGVMDNLDRALRYQEGGTDDRDGLITGLRLTHWQMQELLKSEGLKEIATEGQRFDPRLHEAVDTVPGAPEQDGAIAGESQRGYQFQDETLRPARVTVVKGA